MKKTTVYQILEYTLDGIEIYFETTDKEIANEEFEDYEGNCEIHLVQVLRTNQSEGYYVKGNRKNNKYVQLAD